MTSSLVLVTGISGYTGAHVASRLLAEGYRVRGLVRPHKVSAVQQRYSVHYGDRVEIRPVEDLIKGDFTDVLEGVDSVIHLASPLPGTSDARGTLDAAKEGCLNIVRQAAKAGIKHIVVISSVAALAMLIPGITIKAPLTSNDWFEITEEIAVTWPDPIAVYAASKAIAERTLWAFAKEHPELNIVTLCPTLFIGPFAPEQIIKPGDTSAISTAVCAYNFVNPNVTLPTESLGYVDVRDIAAALVAATRVEGQHRLPFSGEFFDHTEAFPYIAPVRPELKDRLAKATSTGQTKPAIDATPALKVLGLPGLTPWKQSVLDSVDSIVRLEKEWIEAGVDVEEKLAKNQWLGFQINTGTFNIVHE